MLLALFNRIGNEFRRKSITLKVTVRFPICSNLRHFLVPAIYVRATSILGIDQMSTLLNKTLNFFFYILTTYMV